MAKIPNKLIERRRYVRLYVPVAVFYTFPENDKIHSAVTKDISAEGLRFETQDAQLSESALVELKLDLPGTPNPVHAKGKVAWKRRLSLEDSAPSDVGIEIISIEEDNKNTFLKFLCDLIYSLPKGDIK